jgi:hypothetical protein
MDRERLERIGIYYDDEYEEAVPPNAGSDWGLGLVDFVVRPHLNAEYFPIATMASRKPAFIQAFCYYYANQTRRYGTIRVADKTVAPAVLQFRLFFRYRREPW